MGQADVQPSTGSRRFDDPSGLTGFHWHRVNAKLVRSSEITAEERAGVFADDDRRVMVESALEGQAKLSSGRVTRKKNRQAAIDAELAEDRFMWPCSKCYKESPDGKLAD